MSSDKPPTERDEEHPDEAEESTESKMSQDDEEPTELADEQPDEEERMTVDPARDIFASVESGSASSTDDGATPSDDEAQTTESTDEADQPTGTASEGVEAESSSSTTTTEQTATTDTPSPTTETTGTTEATGTTDVTEKDPGIAALASLIIPGAGQIYNGQFVRGAVAFVGVGIVDFLLVIVALVLSLILIGPLFLLLIPVVHILVAYDAYTQAKKINSGEVNPNA